jgi:hypothetical protein
VKQLQEMLRGKCSWLILVCYSVECVAKFSGDLIIKTAVLATDSTDYTDIKNSY